MCRESPALPSRGAACRPVPALQGRHGKQRAGREHRRSSPARPAGLAHWPWPLAVLHRLPELAGPGRHCPSVICSAFPEKSEAGRGMALRVHQATVLGAECRPTRSEAETELQWSTWGRCESGSTTGAGRPVGWRRVNKHSHKLLLNINCGKKPVGLKGLIIRGANPVWGWGNGDIAPETRGLSQAKGSQEGAPVPSATLLSPPVSAKQAAGPTPGARSCPSCTGQSSLPTPKPRAATPAIQSPCQRFRSHTAPRIPASSKPSTGGAALGAPPAVGEPSPTYHHRAGHGPGLSRACSNECMHACMNP